MTDRTGPLQPGTEVTFSGKGVIDEDGDIKVNGVTHTWFVYGSGFCDIDVRPVEDSGAEPATDDGGEWVRRTAEKEILALFKQKIDDLQATDEKPTTAPDPIRLAALHAAVKWAELDVSAEATVATARVFEAYLRGTEQPK